jgi:hypothetical protein
MSGRQSRDSGSQNERDHAQPKREVRQPYISQSYGGEVRRTRNT